MKRVRPRLQALMMPVVTAAKLKRKKLITVGGAAACALVTRCLITACCEPQMTVTQLSAISPGSRARGSDI